MELWKFGSLDGEDHRIKSQASSITSGAGDVRSSPRMNLGTIFCGFLKTSEIPAFEGLASAHHDQRPGPKLAQHMR
ncbi:uncharacterized protein PgNI_12190 [Pyricularia grisea]|uniref:Uncharacterized protein n=1 Tax=Pyricularia grisea TaxID=148305 RepID=A0A6P8AQE9_PYRGI|nr:uncharacterized protein PgNI_12190 [Pyricularia grisea]TLD04281.1 hypothetical protein PgNI_12190 [Pyricularia grisea]